MPARAEASVATGLIGLSAGRPAGLRHNIAALPPSTATDPHTAMIQDMITLGGAVSPIGGRIVFVASPPRAVAIDFWSYGPLPVLPSQALAPNDLIAIACNGLASAVAAVPEVEASKIAALHMEDSAPLAIGTPGSPSTVAGPTKSIWQTDTVGIKIRFNADRLVLGRHAGRLLCFAAQRERAQAGALCAALQLQRPHQPWPRQRITKQAKAARIQLWARSLSSRFGNC
jgi:hypothetical protein